MGARSSAEVAVEALRTRITRWRSTRASSRAPMPEDLWGAAVALCDHFTTHSVSQSLGLGYDRLRRRCIEARLATHIQTPGRSEPPIQFVELGRAEQPAVCPEPAGGHEVEFVRPDGARMILRSREALDLRDLAGAFLGQVR